MEKSKNTMNFRRFTFVKNLKVLCFLALFLLFFNEFLIYYVNYVNWPQLQMINKIQNQSDQSVRLLLVADPQLIGENDEFYGWLARWDSDRYLRNTFLLANSYVKPDATIFLGDLFDEGLKATDQQFKRYFDRFNKIFECEKNRRVNNVKQIFIPGDNDIGGEYVNDRNGNLAKRFENYFGGDLVDIEELKSFVTFIKLDIDYMSSSYDEKKRSILKDKLFKKYDARESSMADSVSLTQPHVQATTTPNKFTIILNHVSVLERPRTEFQMVLYLN